MNPWTLIGWLLVGVLGAGLLVRVLRLFYRLGAALMRRVVRWRKHVRTRGTAPASGQRWHDGRLVLRIDSVYASTCDGTKEDRVAIRCGGSSFSHSLPEWYRRVRDNRMYLEVE